MRINEHEHPAELRHQFFEQLQLFRVPSLPRKHRLTCQVASGMGQAVDKSVPDRVVGMDHHNGNLGGGGLGGLNSLIFEGPDEVDALPDEFTGSRVRRRLIQEIPPVQMEVLAFFVAEVFQALPDAIQGGRDVIEAHVEEANPPDFHWLLRVGYERRHEDGEGEDEHEPDDAAPHGGVLQKYPYAL